LTRKRNTFTLATIALTATLVLAPTAAADEPDAHQDAELSSREVPAPDTGGVEILKQDPDGAAMAGASFTLLTATGTQAATGTTDSTGTLSFTDLDAGVYRLTETSSGSDLHDIAADQDIIVTTDATATVTVIDPFKPADLTLTKTDQDTGEPLADAVITITSADSAVTFTLTTGDDGTAHLELPVTTRTGTDYTATETHAPPGYTLNDSSVTITAEPAAAVSVTLTNTRTEQENPTEPASPSPPTEPDDDGAAEPTPVSTDQPQEAVPQGDGDFLAETGTFAATLVTLIALIVMTVGVGLVVVGYLQAKNSGRNQQQD
jgi:hypothetical protein